MPKTLQLQNCPDADLIMQRFEAWWLCEIVDRPLVSLSVQQSKPLNLPEKDYATTRDRWFDAEFQIEWHDAYFSQLESVGDSLPVFMPNLGPEVLATLFGAELEFSDESSWSVPLVESCRDIAGLKVDFENPYWQNIRKATDLSLEAGKGKWITGFTDFHSNGDLLASLRDPQDLCIEMMDDLEGVRLACENVTPIYLEAYNDLVGRIRAAGQPTLTWLSAPTWGRMMVPNCDFSALISKAMFEEAIWPSIVAEMEQGDRSIYHLDGPNALQHTDLILDSPKLNALQWVYGAGNGPATKWVEVYQKAQAKKKALQVHCSDLADAREMMKVLKPAGVWFTVGGSYSRDEAESFLKELEAWR
jgi:hypothetical protein